MDPLLFSLRNLLSEFIISIHLRRSSAGQATLLRCSAPFWKEPVGWKEFPVNTSRQWWKRMSIGGLWILKIYEDMYLYSGQKNRRQTEEFALDLFERLLESRMSNLPSQAFKQAPLWDQMTFECKTLREKNPLSLRYLLAYKRAGIIFPVFRSAFAGVPNQPCNTHRQGTALCAVPWKMQSNSDAGLNIGRTPVVWDMKWSYLVVVRAYVHWSEQRK